MSDLIDRQAAIDAMAELQGGTSSKGVLKGISKAWKRIEQLPPAQPEQLGTNLAEVGTDCISRQAAIDRLTEYGNGRAVFISVGEAIIRIEQLPPAQPERIIHCKDCEWWTKQECSPQGRCALSGMYPTGGWFCGNARMREVTT